MKQFYTAKDIAGIMEISECKAYEFIRTMNAELEAAGFLTVRGRVPVSYARKRFSLEDISDG